MTIAAAINPALPRVRTGVPDQVRAAGDCTDHTADHCAGRSGNQRTRASADRNAFQCSGLGEDRQGGEGEYKHSSLDERTHGEISLGLNVE
jgi:hypothetical protein